MRFPRLILFLSLGFVGCLAREAANPLLAVQRMHQRAYEAKDDEQLGLYGAACNLYRRLYSLDFAYFNMTLARDAMHACSSARDFDATDTFRSIVKREIRNGSAEILYSKPAWIEKFPGRVINRKLKDSWQKTDVEIQKLAMLSPQERFNHSN